MFFDRKLSVGASDNAEVLVWTFQGRTLYRNDGQLVNDADYVYDSWELGPLVDGSPQVYVQFRGEADGNSNYSGWTIDDVIFKDGSLPDYAACGGCASSPSFAGEWRGRSGRVRGDRRHGELERGRVLGHR